MYKYLISAEVSNIEVPSTSGTGIILEESLEYDKLQEKNLHKEKSISRLNRREQMKLDILLEAYKNTMSAYVEEINIPERSFKELELYTKIRNLTSNITEDAEYQLLSNKYLVFCVEKILNLVILKFKEENISYLVKLSSFCDDEILEWNTFKILFKPTSEISSFEYVLNLWDEFSKIKKQVFKLLEESNLITTNEINTLKEKIILFVDVE